jgi:hypothetical protein
MSHLLERIQSENPEGSVQRALRRSRRSVHGDKLGERLERQLCHAFSLGAEPLFEVGWMWPLCGEALQQLAAILAQGTFEAVERSFCHQVLEEQNVHLNLGRIQD